MNFLFWVKLYSLSFSSKGWRFRMKTILRAVLPFLSSVIVIHSSWGVPLLTSSVPSQSQSPSSASYPVWTPCKKCRHVWYRICRTPGVKGCVVDGKEVSWSKFVKSINEKAQVLAVERLSDGSVVVWFKW